ncbi:flagellar motor protein MotB [Occallatibacter savannae]|uniref:flagellar motor protein MotB n=1 Tax=Occallatibacter savannae TaxID=1002691 RepID=UPI000D69B582|nr:flagellar motor protein MotB [Occallatibacter savannae]
MASKTAPIIVIKKKSKHAGHHGGAWKVAYADFVTAMMSLFIVLWLMNSSEKIKKAVAGYFNDPKGTASLMGTTMTGTGEAVSAAAARDMQKLKEKLEQQIKAKKDLEKLSKQIEITITPEGLRVELLEDRNGTFYQSGSARLSDSGQELLALLASELKTLPNSLLIEGHTDAAPYLEAATYSNWELSADRANAARRLMQQDGVRTDQVTQVRGYADQLLRVKGNPYDASNRRISILVKNQPGVPVEQNKPIHDLSGVQPSSPAAPEEIKGTSESGGGSASRSAEPAPNAQSKPAPGQKGWLGRVRSMLPKFGDK